MTWWMARDPSAAGAPGSGIFKRTTREEEQLRAFNCTELGTLPLPPSLVSKKTLCPPPVCNIAPADEIASKDEVEDTFPKENGSLAVFWVTEFG